MADALEYGLRVSELLDQVHGLGLLWRDCKPQNLLVCGHTLRPIDFEGACWEDDADSALPWGTAGYVPPEWFQPTNKPTIATDLFALGATLHQLLTGLDPTLGRPLDPVGRRRRGVPPTVRALVGALLDDRPARRPRAAWVVQSLREVLSPSQLAA